MAESEPAPSLTFEPLAPIWLDACAEIAATAPDPWSRAVLEKVMAAENHWTLVAVAGSHVSEHRQALGFASFLVMADAADLEMLAVAEGARRRGVATALLRQCLPLLATRGVARALLEARQSNTAAIALYEKIGFKKLALRPGMYANPKEDGVLMGGHL